MERKIGEIFTYEDKTYKVVYVKIGIGCIGCAFKTSGCSKYKSFLGHCSYVFRRDNTGVIFELINNNNNMEIKNNQLTIEIPEGMKIDTENSDLAKGIIKFKFKGPTYEEVFKALNIKEVRGITVSVEHRDKLQALAQLMLIAKYYNKDWRPNWKCSEIKYYIYFDNNSNEYDINYNDAFCRNTIYFKNSKDAKAIIDNPNLREILDTIYKN